MAIKPLPKPELKKAGMKPLGGIKKGLSGPKKIRRPLDEPDVGDPMEGHEFDENGDNGDDAKVVLGAAGQALAAKREAERKSMELTTDGSFYTTFVFDTGEQKAAFFRGLRQKFDVRFEGDLYPDGRKLADALGIELPAVPVKMPKLFRVDKRYGAIATPVPKGKGK